MYQSSAPATVVADGRPVDVADPGHVQVAMSRDRDLGFTVGARHLDAGAEALTPIDENA